MQSPLIGSSIVFVSGNVTLTQQQLRLIRKKEVTREVYWFRTLDQVKRHFDRLMIDKVLVNIRFSIVLDYELTGLAHITQYLGGRGILQYCDFYSLEAIANEVKELQRLLKSK